MRPTGHRTLIGVHFQAMTSRPSSRLIAALIALMFIVAACGGSDSTASVEADAEVAETTDSTTVEEPEPESESETDDDEPEPVIEESAIPIDDRTDREIAIDQLDLMLLQLRTVDLVAVADCVVARLDAEGIEIVGQGAPELAAALSCDPTISDQLFSAASFNVTETQGACIVDGLANAAANTPLDEAEAFFSAATPPNEVLIIIAGQCDVTLEELASGFG